MIALVVFLICMLGGIAIALLTAEWRNEARAQFDAMLSAGLEDVDFARWEQEQRHA